MKNKPILPPGYYTEADAEDVYEKTFDKIFRYFFTIKRKTRKRRIV